MEMELFDMDSFIPAMIAGKHLDLEYTVTEPSVEEAQILYQSACQRLLRPYLWHELAGMAAADFKLFEKDNNIPALADINDHLSIKVLPADDYDWVIVEDIRHGIVKQADESIGIKLRVCNDPRQPQQKVSHFFTADATTTIIIRRIENVVTASYHGRNEKPNVHTGDMLDNIRNGMIAFGAIAGVSRIQWSGLITGFLEKN